MTLSFGESKFKLQKKYLAFFGIVPLLLATALIQVPCPVCGGDGKVSSTGMADVTIVGEPLSTLAGTWMYGCNTFRIYQMDVTLTLQNSGQVDANGFITLQLIDVASGRVLDAVYVVGNAAHQTITQETVVAKFQVATADDPQQSVHVIALIRDSACNACDGKGKVALNAWPLYNSIKNDHANTEIYEMPLVPPLRVDVEGGPN